MPVRRGVRVGVDVGSVRIGVAVSDPDGLVAIPVETVPRSRVTGPGDGTDRLAEIVAEREALEVVVGLPRSLSGREGTSASAVRGYAAALAARVAPVEVRLVDERLTTVTAGRGLQEAGVSGRRARGVVDQVAATTILQAALDAERTTGDPPGDLVVET